MLQQMLIALIGLVVIASQVYAAQNKPTMEERLIRLEEGQKAMNQRIDDLIVMMKNRFEDITNRFEDTNNRFIEIHKRIDDLNSMMRFWFQTMTIILIAIFSAIIAQGILFWRRLVLVETKVTDHLAETEKDRVIALYRQEMDLVQKKLARLEEAMVA